MGLMYLSRHIRPDLAQAINGLSRRLTAWTRADDRALIRLYEFLRTKADHVLLIRDAAGVEGVHARWTLFTDSDFAGERGTRRSTTGCVYGLLYSNGAFALLEWGCLTQKTVSLSTAEAE